MKNKNRKNNPEKVPATSNEGFIQRARKADPDTETYLMTSLPVPKPELAKENKDWEPTTEDDFAKIIEWFSNQRHI
ncbi:MAG: hypothetical protein ACK5G0_01040 [Bacteroidota bacterium]|jgi:hypothetical protein